MKPYTQSYCADPATLQTLRRDGIGWGHDIDCGCLRMDRALHRQGVIGRLIRRIGGRV